MYKISWILKCHYKFETLQKDCSKGDLILIKISLIASELSKAKEWKLQKWLAGTTNIWGLKILDNSSVGIIRAS